MGNQHSDQASQKPFRRKRLFVDVKLQGALLAHTTLYWFYCLLSVSVMAIAWIVLMKKPSSSGELFHELWHNFGPALIGAAFLLPLVLLDCLRLSNRFAGPMVRIQREMKHLADGETANKIKLRNGDFWFDFVENLNRVIDRMPVANELSIPSPASTHADVAPATGVEPATTPSLTNLAPVNVAPDNVTASSIYADVSV